MKRKKSVFITALFAVIAVALALVIFLGLPKALLPQQESSSTPKPKPAFSSKPMAVYTLKQHLALCDSVVSGKVIKADITETGTQYTLKILRVLKGRNYTSLGYAFVVGKPTLQSGETYLFTGITGAEKYHYYEPYDKAPWVFCVREEKMCLPPLCGEGYMVEDLSEIPLKKVEDFCRE